MHATAAPHRSGPIELAVPTPPVPADAAPRASITFFSGLTTLTGTGTSTPAVAQTPNIPAAAPESPATTLTNSLVGTPL